MIDSNVTIKLEDHAQDIYVHIYKLKAIIDYAIEVSSHGSCENVKRFIEAFSIGNIPADLTVRCSESPLFLVWQRVTKCN